MAKYTSEELLRLGKETNEMDFAKPTPIQLLTDADIVVNKMHKNENGETVIDDFRITSFSISL